MREIESAVHLICESISNACSLTIPLPEDEMSIVTDAAGSGIGGLLQVQRKGIWEAAAFFSRQTKDRREDIRQLNWRLWH